jgi:hypothetical protein
MVRPSRFRHQQTSLAFAFRKRSAYSACKRYRAGIEVSLRRNTAQATRASLLAKATTATFLGTRGVARAAIGRYRGLGASNARREPK